MFFIPPINKWANSSQTKEKPVETFFDRWVNPAPKTKEASAKGELFDIALKELSNPQPIRPGSLADTLYKLLNKERPESKPKGLTVKERFYIGLETSYAQLEETQRLAERANHIMALTEAYPALAANVLNDPAITDKTQALATLSAELTQRLTQVEKAKTKDVKPSWQLLTTPDEGDIWTVSREASARPVKTKRHI